MMLLTQENRKALPALYSQDGKGLDATAHVKLFHPVGRYTFYVTEFDGNDTFFGYTVSPLGPDCDEFGYANLSELESINVRGLGIERDLYFKPMTIREALIAEGHAAKPERIAS